MNLSSAVVLAAGEGRRLRPLTKHRPKPMLPAANRPILEYVLDALIDAGIDDLHLVVGYKADRVQNHFGTTYRNRNITYHHQAKQLGSGHALLQASNALDSDFMVVNGDQLIDHEIIEAVRDAHTVEDLATLAVIESEEASEYGAVRLDGDRITELIERPGDESYRLLNAGIYAFAPSFFAEIESTPRQHGELSLPDTIGRLTGIEGAVRGVKTDGTWQDATYPWDLLSLSREILQAENLVNEPEIESGVYIDPTASVHSDATVQGPAIIGPDSVIGPQAVIGPNTALGQNVTVNAGAVVHDSVIDGDTRIRANATVIDTVTGQSVQIGPGTTVTGGKGDVTIGTTVHTETRLGGVFADRAILGGGVTVEPGVLVGASARIHSGCSVTRNIDENAEVSR
ncbi:glucose-1-phosphate thymidylyltransferase [Halogranum gelatinilyticum]|uniref:Bifunctional protein GlmU n=1 Tax=Halogranum gelatinilyticum TaxID=660521 RepID=A0A1G9X6V0_9EURY|nr:bifunctional sugar-1-phosphate nucleotidylyltransferase/acetyltransferase [Halogranum gelatinilyticum]SDM92226.1 glucose-1-phosphate thymidylyltransferase [Halogranum gelatinilyticum]